MPQRQVALSPRLPPPWGWMRRCLGPQVALSPCLPPSWGWMWRCLGPPPQTPPGPPVRVWRGKAAPRWDTHFVSSEPCPQGELPAALQEADFHVVDFAPVEHHQHVGLGPGPRGAVSDQESAVLKRKGRAVTSRGCRRPTLAAVAVARLRV